MRKPLPYEVGVAAKGFSPEAAAYEHRLAADYGMAMRIYEARRAVQAPAEAQSLAF